MAHGGRIGLQDGKSANLIRQTESIQELYDAYGKEVVDNAAKEWAEMSNKEKNRTRKIKIQNFDKMENATDRGNFKRKFKDDIEKYGEWNPERKIISRQKRVLKDQGIQIKLLEETNKKKFFDAKKFAKANKITMKELKYQAKLLRNNIYDKRMLVSGKDMGGATLTWIPDDLKAADNALDKMWKSELIVNDRNVIDNLFYDAFGKPDSPKHNPKKFLAIKDNLNEYRQLKKAIKAKYPHINLQLDHPLSKSILDKIFNASAEELTRVNVLDAHLNNSFKDSLSRKYQKSLGYNVKGEKVGTVNLEAKKAVEKVARDLKLNIGKVSTDLKDFKYGVKEFQKLNIRDEIIKSLKNQKDLSLNFKSYIKNNPDLLKIAGYDDPSKIGTKLTKVTDKQIQEIEKIFKERGIKLKKGQAGFIATDIFKDAKKLGPKGLRLLASDWVWPEIVIGWLDKKNNIQKGMSEERASSEMWKNMTFGLWDKGGTENTILEQAKKLGYGEKDIKALEHIMRYGKLSKEIKDTEVGIEGMEKGYTPFSSEKGAQQLKEKLENLKKEQESVAGFYFGAIGDKDPNYGFELYDQAAKELMRTEWNRSLEGRKKRTDPYAGQMGSEFQEIFAMTPNWYETKEKIAAMSPEELDKWNLQERGIGYERVHPMYGAAMSYKQMEPLRDQMDYMYAGGGMVGIRKPSAIAPTGGPMSQGLRSLYNNGRKR